jgi:hypothetical protein
MMPLPRYPGARFARGDPTSVRRHGATTRGGADRTTRDAGRRPTDPTWTARGVVAQWATPRDVPTTPIQTPIPNTVDLSIRQGILQCPLWA